ncbi:unnamed protein product [Closterium sp. Naga37s-1]|nr:unnamed protein product [Closterium sp. Naga37s-1]
MELLHGQQREELVGREGIAAPEELAVDQEAGSEAPAAAAAAGNGATVTESEAAVAVEAVAAAGPEWVVAEETGAEALQPGELEQAVDPEQTEELVLAASPEPVTAAALAAAVTAAAGEQDGDRAEEDAPIAAASAETSAAAKGASTQGHDHEGSDRRGHAPAASAGAARGKTVKKKLRAQRAPRRGSPGANREVTRQSRLTQRGSRRAEHHRPGAVDETLRIWVGEAQRQARGEAEPAVQEADGEEVAQSLVEERRCCGRERGGNATIALNRWRIPRLRMKQMLKGVRTGGL